MQVWMPFLSFIACRITWFTLPLCLASAELPPGWAIAHDASGKAYYWHKKTQKTTWERPTADTPIN
jgi:hypothetical protein